MALKLMLAKGDKLMIGTDILLEVLSTGRRMQIAVVAPPEQHIAKVPADIDDYAKKARRWPPDNL